MRQENNADLQSIDTQNLNFQKIMKTNTPSPAIASGEVGLNRNDIGYQHNYSNQGTTDILRNLGGGLNDIGEMISE